MKSILYNVLREPLSIIDFKTKISEGVANVKLVDDSSLYINGDIFQIEFQNKYGVSSIIDKNGNPTDWKIFHSDDLRKNFTSLKNLPFVCNYNTARIASENKEDYFFIFSKSQIINGSNASYWSDSKEFDVELYLNKSNRLCDVFGLSIFHSAKAYVPDIIELNNGSIVSEPLPNVRWTTMFGGSALFDKTNDTLYIRDGKTKHINGSVLLLSPLNYGHWFAQNLPQIHALSVLSKNNVVDPSSVFISIPNQSEFPLLKLYLNSINFDAQIIDPVSEDIGTLTADKIILGTTCSSVPPFTWPSYIKESLNVLREKNPLKSKKILFVGRGDVGNSRGLINENEVIEDIRNAGYPVEVVLAGNLTVEQQREVFSEAILVIGPHGSGLNNAFFAHQQCGVIEIACETIQQNRQWFHHMFTIAEQPYMGVNVKLPENPAWNAPYRVESSGIIQNIKLFFENRESMTTISSDISK